MLALLAFDAMIVVSAARGAGDWNDGQITWLAYDKGLEEAKTTNKPVCLVFFTEWCPHCTNYSRVFHDPKIVDLAKRFVMIRVDRDLDPTVSAKYAPDGQYIPRTYFLSQQGELDPAALASGMQKALEKLS
jgi:thiol-disulfide isomerase/thioredoxin